jgi:hypothetical protein
MAHCNQCGFDWTPRVESPVACTRCKRYDYRDAKKSRDGVLVPLKADVRVDRPSRIPIITGLCSHGGDPKTCRIGTCVEKRGTK